jgi:hypothetical protein
VSIHGKNILLDSFFCFFLFFSSIDNFYCWLLLMKDDPHTA